MKKIILIFASIVFSSLFFQKELGLNFFVFSLISTGIIGLLHPLKFTDRKIMLKAGIYILAASMVFVFHNALSITTGIISFVLFIGSVSNKNSSIYIQFLNGFYSSIVAAFVKHYERVNTEIEQVKKRETNYLYWLKIIGIPLFVMLIFIALYRNANPIFDELISKIDFSFLNSQWILFTVLGYYLLYNITNPISIEPITTVDLETENVLKNEFTNISIEKTKNENQLGLVLMVLLNLLIVFLLVTDIFYLTQNSTSLSVSELSSQVHKGINALITSIVLAIILIIYFFRGALNFYKENNTLRMATYIWIFLNGILVLVTLYKNYQYVHTYGLTYKRIGVFIYLLLSFSGLIFTFIKVKSIKNITYLFRRNIEIAFGVLIVATLINWDVLITKYNLEYSNEAQVDISYLVRLENNADVLKKYDDTIHFNYNLSNKIHNKHKIYHRKLANKSWQEWTFDNLKK